ncbi:MAG: UvrB/UvrC motif-containing protein, partial [Polyangiaceae bacterium]
RSLIQTIGRAARNVNGRVIMYADHLTDAMKYAISETDRRRALQEKYNLEHGIIPATIVRAIMNINPASGIIDYLNIPKYGPGTRGPSDKGKPADNDLSEQIQAMRLEMFAAAESLEFEKAARLRDELKKLEALAGGPGAAGADAYEPYGKAKRVSGRAPKNTSRTKKSGITIAGGKTGTRGKSRKMKP